jgi:hypothetical protein
MRVAGVKTLEQANGYLAIDSLVLWVRELNSGSGESPTMPIGIREEPQLGGLR